MLISIYHDYFKSAYIKDNAALYCRLRVFNPLNTTNMILIERTRHNMYCINPLYNNPTDEKFILYISIIWKIVLIKLHYSILLYCTCNVYFYTFNFNLIIHLYYSIYNIYLFYSYLFILV